MHYSQIVIDVYIFKKKSNLITIKILFIFIYLLVYIYIDVYTIVG
jgi:hypothetical protein